MKERWRVCFLVSMVPAVVGAALSPISAEAQGPRGEWATLGPEAHGAVIATVIDFFFSETNRFRTGPCTEIGTCTGELRRSPGQDLAAMARSGTVAVSVVSDRTSRHLLPGLDDTDWAPRALSEALALSLEPPIVFVPAEASAIHRVQKRGLAPTVGMRYADPGSGALIAECYLQPREHRDAYGCDLHGDTELLVVVTYPVILPVAGGSEVAMTVSMYRQAEWDQETSREIYVKSVRLSHSEEFGWVPYRELFPVSINYGR